MNNSSVFSKGGKIFDTSNLRGDFFGGLTAGVVALPLALAFGEASGAGPIAGLWGAIIVGFFASLFGGTGSQVTGPLVRWWLYSPACLRRFLVIQRWFLRQ